MLVYLHNMLVCIHDNNYDGILLLIISLGLILYVASGHKRYCRVLLTCQIIIYKCLREYYNLAQVNKLYTCARLSYALRHFIIMAMCSV